ncbi:MAG TPA: sigma 54-interacting transcriptional regulator [Kofleriaceae bacterium]|jgi:DNA-binding NtrC family response regulator|nr:sigma 54-interacting transcriptional regulator [Kofleriaceae bacterium]
MATLSSATISTLAAGGGPSEPAAPPVAQLILSMHCDRPSAAPARHVLAELDEVRFARGPARIERDAAARRLTLHIPDPRMSADHGRLVRRGLAWTLDDAASKNGCVINGAPARRGVLGDGDLLELGHTLFVFRVAPAPPGPPDVTADQLAHADGELATFSAELGAAFARLDRIADTDVPVLILGETGTGKELVARALHARSGRPGAFIAVNCGALPETLVEAELFGARRGAYSGALADRPGLVRGADRGTVFLDEIAELRAGSQAAFLRVLQEHEVLPLGETRAIKVDVRFCAATHRPLDELVEHGAFRRDLYARLFGLTIELLPLRRRREDLGLLVRALLARRPGGGRARFTPPAARLLHRHAWPYNVRELERALALAVALAEDRAIDAGDLALERAPRPVAAAAAASLPPPLDDDDDDALRARLVGLLEAHRGNIAAVARALDKDRMQVHRWVRRFAIDLAAFRR